MRDMKNLLALACMASTLMVTVARAQVSDEQYVQIYNLIQQGDALNNSDQPALALAKYQGALAALQEFQRLYPGWNTTVVNFRLNYLASKIADLSGRMPAVTNAPPPAGVAGAVGPPVLHGGAIRPAAATTVPTEIQAQLALLQNQVQQLQANNELLQAKLKEALTAQPAAADPREITKAQDQIQSLLKQNDLFKITLAQEQVKSARGADQKTLDETRQTLAEANVKLAEQTDRARTLADEKQKLQGRLDELARKGQATPALDATKKALADANRKLAEQQQLTFRLSLEKEALQSRLKTVLASGDTGEALRAENAVLKKQVADLKSAAPTPGKADGLNRQLTEAQTKIAALTSDVELLRLEKMALEGRVKQMSAPSAAAKPPPMIGRPEDAARLKQLERERDDLQKQLEAANRELGGLKGKAAGARINELTNQVALLRARLDVFEARQVPYTPEELALFTHPDPKPAEPIASKRPVKTLSAGAAALVADAQRHFAAKQYDQAETEYLEVLRQDQSNVYTLANLAAIQLEMDHFDEAEKHLKQALALAPDDVYALTVLGNLKFRQEKYNDALDALSRAARADPQNAEVQNLLGVTLSHKGLRGPAETALRKAIQLDPNYGAAHNNLAVVYMTANPSSPELARWHYQKALAAGHPRNPDLERMLEEKTPAGGK